MVVKNDKAGRVSLVVLVDQGCSISPVGDLPDPFSILPLMGQLSRFDIPITWAAEDPAHSSVAQQVRKVAAWHEIAVWASSSWVRWHALANRASDELERRRRDAWRASMPVMSIVLSDLSPTEFPWLAGARNFAVVSGCPLESWRLPPATGTSDGSARFGEGPWLALRVVWLHSPTIWTSDADALGARFQVCQTAKEGGTTIVLARLSEMVASSSGVLRLLETLQQLEVRGSIEAVSLGDCVPSGRAPSDRGPSEKRTGAKARRGQHSILRPAA